MSPTTAIATYPYYERLGWIRYLLIHFTGGRIETHFHIFGSLAFLAFYRDWRVLLTASAVVMADHLFRGALWPRSVFGVLNASVWRAMEHGGWVLFEDGFLIWACVRNVREMRQIAEHRAELETTNARIESTVTQRTWELAVAKERCDRALKASQNGLWDWDLQSGKVLVSGHFIDMLGLVPGTVEVCCRDLESMLHPDDREGRNQALRAHLEGGVPYEIECRMRRPEGEYRWYRTRGQALRDESGKPVRMAGSVADINDRRRADLAERERRSLEEAVKSMQQVLGVVGHELRTPLAGVRAISELLLDPQMAASEQAAQFLTSMNEEVIRMSDTIDNILEAARLSSGVAQWKWSRFTLRAVCEEALDTIRPLVDTHAIRLVCETEEPDPEMSGDRHAAFRVVMNLLSNARKYTSSGSIAVRVRTEVTQPEMKWVVIQIQDTGQGIPSEVAGKLGQAFALNSGVIGADHVTGSGLGLAICKGIVAAHGGSITVKSEKGIGTTFLVRMRADLEHAVTMAETPIALEAAL